MSKELQVMDLPKRMKAVAFIKSRKSHEKVQAKCREISRICLSKGICLHDFIVDESAGIDIDRGAIDKLMKRLEQGEYECVVVLSLYDFTKDMDDLVQFLTNLSLLGSKVYSIDEGRFITIELEDEE